MKKNADVWALMAYYDVSTFDLADAMKVSQSKVSRMLRYELDPDKKKCFEDTIKKIGLEGDVSNE